jgi:hypothetical protein
MNDEKKNAFTKSGGSPPTQRKLSWQYDNLASKIQLASRQFAATRILCFFGHAANDGGTSHHGYASIMANTGIRSRNSVAVAIKYLLTVGIDEKQPILTRTKGGKGKETSHYKLHLGAMQKLVEHQGIFDIETGKQSRYKQSEGVPVTGIPTEEGVPVNGDTGVPVSDRGVPVTVTPYTCDEYRGVPVTETVTLNEPSMNPHKSNPKENPLSKARAASESESSSSDAFDEADLAAAEAAVRSSTPHGNGSPRNSFGGDSKSRQPVFSLKRWCPYCNEPAKLGGENADVGMITCPHCGAENLGLTAPRSDASGKREMEQLLDGSSVDDRAEVYKYASVSQRRWIAMTKFADEMTTVLAETGESK